MKTTLSSLKKQDWRKVKSETEKMNDLLTNDKRCGVKRFDIRMSKISLLKTTDRK